MAKDAATFRTKIEQQITTSLSEKFNSRGNGGLGFIPSVRNILAVFYCQGEAFLRLLDEVHKKAWDQERILIEGLQYLVTKVPHQVLILKHQHKIMNQYILGLR